MKKSWRTKFAVAGNGLSVAVRHHNSFRIHLLASALVLSVGFLLELEVWRWAFLIAAIFMVLVAELFNTAIEHLAKAITREQNPELKNSLDVAAAAVLVTSIGAVILGILILGGPLFK